MKTTRTITVVFEIEDQSEAQSIWNAHMSNEKVLGSKVRAISDGNLVSEIDKLNDLLNDVAEIATKLPCSKATDELIDALDI